MTTDKRTENYRAKRDFTSTSEPEGSSGRGRVEGHRFVIQHHRARSDHFDVRLEIDGVLVSWAVPKGPSTDPRDKRMARRTEDHPLDYADFEGVIPSGHYGAGTVQVWDRGTFDNVTSDDDTPVALAEALSQGHLSFFLHGTKLQGGYALTRIRDGDDETWLLVKMADDAADARRKPTRTQGDSVVTGRSMREIRDEEQPDDA